MYRPLPDGITVGPSNIEGTGLLTTKRIKADVVLGIVHIANKNFRSRFPPINKISKTAFKIIKYWMNSYHKNFIKF